MRVNIWTLGLVLAACVGIGIVAYEQGKVQEDAANAGPFASLQAWINSTF